MAGIAFGQMGERCINLGAKVRVGWSCGSRSRPLAVCAKWIYTYKTVRAHGKICFAGFGMLHSEPHGAKKRHLHPHVLL